MADMAHSIHMTREQIRVISKVLEGTPDVKYVRLASARSERVDYQLHYRDGTFGSHVHVTREGSVRDAR